jgi:predicted hydrocarbon binding protein
MQLLILVVLFSPFTITECLAETQSVTADGMATVQDNQAISRDNAIKDALRKAVEQAVGLMLSSETIVENAALVRDNIYSKTQGYIKQYKIVKEAPDQNIYLVTVLAVIGVSDLKNDLGALGLLQARVGKPRTLFMVREQHIGRDALMYLPAGEIGAVEAAMKEEFMNKEFNVIDRVSAKGNLPVNSATDLSDATVRETGRKLGAEIVIKVTANVREGARTPGSSVGSYLADITANAIRVDNGQVLASGRGQGVARHIAQNIGENSALDQAGRDVGKKLIDQIIAKWIVETSGVQLTQITIRGLKDMQELSKIKEFLSGQLRGVQDVIQRSYEGGVAILDVSAKTNAQQIGDELAAKNIPDFTLDITGATANTLEIAITADPAGK